MSVVSSSYHTGRPCRCVSAIEVLLRRAKRNEPVSVTNYACGARTFNARAQRARALPGGMVWAYSVRDETSMALYAFDGTWNSAKTDDENGPTNTNVYRFYQAYHR